MKPLYNITYRQLGSSTFLSIVCNRGKISATSAEKVIPPVIEYDEKGNFTLLGPQEIVSSVKQHPYKSNSKDFSEERLADLQVDALLKHLEHFPTMPTVLQNGVQVPHPVAEHIYSNIIYLKPNTELGDKLKAMGYVKKTKELPVILDKVVKNFEAKHRIKIDLFSVPKKEVGSFAYIAGSDGFGIPAKTLAFGFHKAIPCDRIARELSSLKSAEKFTNPALLPFTLPEKLKPFVTMVRVAIVGVKTSMLDSADLFPSIIPKIACNLTRQKIIKDIEKVPGKERNLAYRPFRAGIELVHIATDKIDESKVKPGTIRLIFPSGVKVAGQLQDNQAKDAYGMDIDALLDFETFSKKGAVAAFAMLSGKAWNTNPTLEDCIKIFESMEKETVYWGSEKFEGYVGYLPVMRPDQRYDELSKASDQVTVDLIAKAIMGKDYKVRNKVENAYKELKEFRSVLQKELVKVNKDTHE